MSPGNPNVLTAQTYTQVETGREDRTISRPKHSISAGGRYGQEAFFWGREIRANQGAGKTQLVALEIRAYAMINPPIGSARCP